MSEGKKGDAKRHKPGQGSHQPTERSEKVLNKGQTNPETGPSLESKEKMVKRKVLSAEKKKMLAIVEGDHLGNLLPKLKRG